MKKQIGTVFSLLLSCSTSWVYADAVQELLSVLEPVKGISAAFTQDTYDNKGVVQQHNEGELKAEEPNHFYWKTVDPFPQEIITDGKTLWVYDPDLQQVVVKPFEENYSKTPAMLFAGNAVAISQQFKVEKIEGIAQGFRLLPKQQQKDLFQSLDLVFEDKQPVSMTILDAMQQKTIIHFRSVKMNPSTLEAQFRFDPPKGVEVLKAK